MKTLKSLSFLALSLCLFVGTSFAQKTKPRPAGTKPATTPTPEPTPAAKAVSPAETFFNEGLKCDSKDYDCQVSNFTKAINLQLNTKAVFQKRAAAYMGREDYEKAIADFSKLIDLDLNDANGFKNRGKAYLAMEGNSERFTNAIKDFSSAIDLEPKDSEAYVFRGDAYLKSGLSDKAFSDYSNGIRLQPNFAAGYFGRAMAVSTQKQEYTSAEADFSKAVELDPQNELYRRQLWVAQTSSVPASAIDRNSRIDAVSLKIFNEGILINPSSIFMHSQRGLTYEGLKENGKAIEDYTRAISLFKNTRPRENIHDFFIAASGLAGIFGEMKDDSKAIATLTDAIETVPTSPIGYYYRGLFYINRDKAKAVADWTVGSRTGSDKPWQKNNADAIEHFAKMDADWKRQNADILQKLTAENELQQRQAMEKIQKRAAAFKAAGDVIGNVVGTIVQSKQNTSTASNNSSQVPTGQTTNPTTNPSSGNGSSGAASTGELAKGGTPGNDQHIYEIRQDASIDNSCSRGNADQMEQCWGPWQMASSSVVQIRVKGPIAFKGNLVNQDMSKSVTYEWAIQARNTSSNVVCINVDVLPPDGRTGTFISCMIPQGTQQFRGTEYLKTLVKSSQLNMRTYNVEVCQKPEQVDSRTYRCLAWPGQSTN